MIGIPGCGKTTYSKINFPNHAYVSLDQIKDREKEYKLIEKYLKNRTSIVIDDTNLTKKVRKNHFVRFKKYDPKVVGIFFNYPMSKIRIQNSNRFKKVPEKTIFIMQKQLEIPSEDEGFSKIIEIT